MYIFSSKARLFRFFITAPPEKMPKSHTMTVKILILLKVFVKTPISKSISKSANGPAQEILPAPKGMAMEIH